MTDEINAYVRSDACKTALVDRLTKMPRKLPEMWTVPNTGLVVTVLLAVTLNEPPPPPNP